MKVGLLGLGKMGGGIAQNLLSEHEVVVWNRSKEITEEFKSANPTVQTSYDLEDLASKLDSPKIIWIMVPHGAVDELLSQVKKIVSTGDVIIDGGNSNYKDTQRRFEEFENLNIHFLGIGVSGGILARENGYPLMVGGSERGYEIVRPILETLSKPAGGYEYFGEGGAGHFVKMIHNGVEYAMMQGLGEGFEVLERSDYKLDLLKVANLWKKGTIISGFLLDRAAEMLKEDPTLSEFSGVVSRSGEGDWTLEAAAEEGVTIPAIETSVQYRKDSEADGEVQKSFTAKTINALRRAFGGHEVKKI
jgi:6-phosphogluconate dehydrogenase